MKTAAILLLVFLFVRPCLTGQITVSERLMFDDGRSVLTENDRARLNGLCAKSRDIASGHIKLTGYRDLAEERKYGKNLVEERLTAVLNYLVSMNQGFSIEEVTIVPEMVGHALIKNGEIQRGHPVECRLIEHFPGDGDPNHISADVKKERDTVIKAVNGTRVRIPAGAFRPYRISDFEIGIDELFSIQELSNHNMSTMSSAGAAIFHLRPVRIRVRTRNKETPVPEKLILPAAILIPVDSSMALQDTAAVSIFVQGSATRTFITWKKSTGPVKTVKYGGKHYYMVHTGDFEYLAVGLCKKSNDRRAFRIPNFHEQSIVISSDKYNLLLKYTGGHDTRIYIPDILQLPDSGASLVITITGHDKRGNQYLLVPSPMLPLVRKQKTGDPVILRKYITKMAGM